jgi:hypothetical protein
MTVDTFATAKRTPLRQRLSRPDGLLGAAAAVLLPLGVLVILLGWYGAAHTPYLFEQVPYLISGGLIGLALVLGGGLAYFATWIARGVSAQQQSSDELVGLLREIRDQLATRPAEAPARSAKRQANGHSTFVATAGGSMLHRADCSIVTGRADVRPVDSSSGLSPCGLCNPLSRLTV